MGRPQPPPTPWDPTPMPMDLLNNDPILRMFRIDFAPRHRQPPLARVAVATAISIVGSLLADAALVAAGTHLFPSTKGYPHFLFGDYAKLTVVGILIAAAGWPIVTRVSSAPRWLYFRAAILTTVILFLPDVWLLVRGDPPEAVLVLMVMHVAIAVITYNAIVRLAPVGTRTLRSVRSSRPEDGSSGDGPTVRRMTNTQDPRSVD